MQKYARNRDRYSDYAQELCCTHHKIGPATGRRSELCERKARPELHSTSDLHHISISQTLNVTRGALCAHIVRIDVRWDAYGSTQYLSISPSLSLISISISHPITSFHPQFLAGGLTGGASPVKMKSF